MREFIIHFLPRVYLWIPFVLGVMVFVNTARYGFVYDDKYFHDFSELHHLSSLPLVFRLPYNTLTPAGGTYRPVPMATIVLTYGLFGESPLPFHLTNIVLHGVISALIYLLLTRTFAFNALASLATATVFAVLPIHSEVVANIKSRDELLAALFFLLLWLCFERGRKRKVWLGVSSFFFFLALLSKEMAIAFPLIVAGSALVRFPSEWKRTAMSMIWWVPAVALYLLLRSQAQGTGVASQYVYSYVHNPLFNVGFVDRMFSSLSVLGIYLEKIIVPISLSATYHYAHFVPVSSPFQTYTWASGLVGVGALLYLFARHSGRKDAIVLGLTVFTLSYFSISQVIPVADVMAERWMYLPSLGIVIIVVFWVFDMLRYKKNIFIIFIFIVCSLYTFRTVSRNTVWSSSKALFTSMTIDAPRSARGHEFLAQEYLRESDLEKAKIHANISISIYKDTVSLHNLLALIAMTGGRMDDAQKELTESTNIAPSVVQTQRLWAAFYYTLGDYDEAYVHSKKMIDGKYLYQFQDKFSHALILAKLKRYDEARSWIATFSQRDMNRSDAKYIQAILLYKTGKEKEALDIVWNEKLPPRQRLIELDSF